MHTYLEGIVKDVDSIRYSSAEDMRSKGVEVFPETKLLKVNPKEHTIVVKDVTTGEEREESYDKLILGIGTEPNIPKIDGIDLDGISLYGGRDCAVRLRHKIDTPEIKNVVVCGGGYIGLEAAMSFAKGGKKVTMINRSDRPLGVNLDKELVDILLDEIEKHNITFKGGEDVKAFKGKDGKVVAVETDKNEYPADYVITALGSHPATKFLEGVIDLDQRGHIITDDYMRTSEEDIFAAGGATLIKYNPTDGYANIDLATNARKQGRVAAKNLEGENFQYQGTQGTSALEVFDYKFACTGINEKTSKGADFDVDSVYVETKVLDDYMPDEMNEKVYGKLYFDRDTRRVRGGQILSKKDLTGYIQALSMAIRGKLTVDDLAFGDFFFQPMFDRPWSLLNELGLAAQEKLDQ